MFAPIANLPKPESPLRSLLVKMGLSSCLVAAVVGGIFCTLGAMQLGGFSILGHLNPTVISALSVSGGWVLAISLVTAIGIVVIARLKERLRVLEDFRTNDNQEETLEDLKKRIHWEVYEDTLRSPAEIKKWVNLDMPLDFAKTLPKANYYFTVCSSARFQFESEIEHFENFITSKIQESRKDLTFIVVILRSGSNAHRVQIGEEEQLQLSTLAVKYDIKIESMCIRFERFPSTNYFKVYPFPDAEKEGLN